MKIRSASFDDLPFVEHMLFEAFFWDGSLERPLFQEFRQHPEFQKQLAGWGRAGDRALIAEVQGSKAGAAWYRYWTKERHSYGFVDLGIPEIGIGVARAFRSQGVGRALLRALIQLARTEGISALSLSVAAANFALDLYRSEGFEKVGASGSSWTMVLSLESG